MEINAIDGYAIRHALAAWAEYSIGLGTFCADRQSVAASAAQPAYPAPCAAAAAAACRDCSMTGLPRESRLRLFHLRSTTVPVRASPRSSRSQRTPESSRQSPSSIRSRRAVS